MTSNVVNFKKRAPEKSMLNGGRRRPTDVEYVEALMEQFYELPFPIAMGFAEAVLTWVEKTAEK